VTTSLLGLGPTTSQESAEPASNRGVTGALKAPDLADYVGAVDIASGAQGTVRQVFETGLLRPVAMKLLDPRLAREEVHRKRFVEEAQITAQLDHPNIPPVHRVGIDGDGTMYFTMKLLRGDTFEQLLARRAHHGGWPQLFKVLQVFVTVCNAVAFAHGRGVIHRDLKPENIMVGEHGQVYVMDWGIARILGAPRPSGQDTLPPVRVWGSATDESGVIAGTPGYMAPEQALGAIDEIDERTDVFALGAILYRVLVDRPPYEGRDALTTIVKAASGEYEPPERAASHPAPRGLCDVIARAMSTDRAKRYQSVAQLRDDVEAFMRNPTQLSVRRFEAGAIIVREGEKAEAAYVILVGRVLVYKTIGGRKVPLCELGPGATFGEAAIFSLQARTASVDAIEAVSALEVSRESLDLELQRTSMLAPLVRQLASRFSAVDEELTSQRRSRDVMDRAALLYSVTRGIVVAPGQKAVAWTPMRDHLCATFGCSAEDATLAVLSMPEADLDVENDVVHISMDV
jgi:serine/threonine-protein kinase